MDASRTTNDPKGKQVKNLPRVNPCLNRHYHYLVLAFCINIIVSLSLTPTTAMPYDFPNIIRPANQWLSWKVPLFLFGKFGADYAIFNVIAALGARTLEHVGLPMPMALHASFKIWLVVANLAVAVILVKFISQYDVDRAILVGAAWLVSPMVIWVAGVDAQIEPITALAIVAGIYLCDKKRWATAGLIAALGTGIEYLPMVVVIYVITLWLGRHISIRSVIRFGMGTLTGLILSFGPVVTSSIGRASLFGGLIKSQVAIHATKTVIFPGSIWWFFHNVSVGIEGAGLWYVIFGIVVVAIVALQSRRLRNTGNRQEAVIAVSLCLLGAIFLDPLVLPQFAMIAEIAILYIYAIARIPLTWAVLVGSADLGGWLLSTPIAYWFEDDYPNIWRHHPLTISITSLSPTGTNVAFSAVGIALVAIFCIIAFEQVRDYTLPGTMYRIVNTVCVCGSSVLILLLASWSVVPAIWTAPFASSSPQLFETTPAINNMPATRVVVHDKLKVEFNRILVEAIKGASVHPIGKIQYTPKIEYQQRQVGSYKDNPTVTLRTPFKIGSVTYVTQIGIEWLVDEPPGFPYKRTMLHVICRGREFNEKPATFGNYVATNPWRTINFLVNIGHCGPPTMRLYNRSAKVIRVNASPNGKPWLIVWPSEGLVYGNYGNTGKFGVARFVAPIVGSGSGNLEVPLQPLLAGDITVPPDTFSSAIVGAVISWPHALDALKDADLIELVGGGIACISALISLALLSRWIIRLRAHRGFE